MNHAFFEVTPNTKTRNLCHSTFLTRNTHPANLYLALLQSSIATYVFEYPNTHARTHKGPGNRIDQHSSIIMHKLNELVREL